MRLSATSHVDRCTFWAWSRSHPTPNFKRRKPTCEENVFKPSGRFIFLPLTSLTPPVSFLRFLCKESNLNLEKKIQAPWFAGADLRIVLCVWIRTHTYFADLMVNVAHSLCAYKLSPQEQGLREMHFQRHKWEQWGRHCSALAAQLLKRKNRYRSSGVFL